MKLKFLIILSILFSKALLAQDASFHKTKEIINATYESKTDAGYLFINNIDTTPILINQIEPRILLKFSLNDDSLIGSTFRVSYGKAYIYPEHKNATNSEPINEKLVLLNLESIE